MNYCDIRFSPYSLIFGFIFIISTLNSCQSIKPDSKYPRWVGDIAFDKNTDNPNFYLCKENEIIQYHNNYGALEYKGEKLELIKTFNNLYKAPVNSQQSGLIRIRFVVNCKGETDRFRLISMDTHYNEYKFENSITDQLMRICKGLDGWIPKKYEGRDADYYQYLIFKIENGAIKEIMP